MTDFCYEPNLDLEERDPNDMVAHIKVKFNDIIAEPDNFQSCDCTWDASTCIYDCCFLVVYHVSSFFCGCWIAGYYGIVASLSGFVHIWHCTPFIKCFDLTLWPFRCCYALCVKCAISPWFEACGYFFSAFEDNPNPTMQWAAA